MAAPLADTLFWAAALAIALAQVMIFRSTRRGMRHAPARSRWAIEWGYALLPAVALVLVLAWTWRTMHPSVVRIDVRPAAGKGIS